MKKTPTRQPNHKKTTDVHVRLNHNHAVCNTIEGQVCTSNLSISRTETDLWSSWSSLLHGLRISRESRPTARHLDGLHRPILLCQQRWLLLGRTEHPGTFPALFHPAKSTSMAANARDGTRDPPLGLDVQITVDSHRARQSQTQSTGTERAEYNSFSQR